jgi:hypothetical protein
MRSEPELRRIIQVVAVALFAGACSGESEPAEAAPAGITPRQMADALHAVMESDRIVYTRNVVNRLQNEESVIRATEHWQDDKTLPLPAQMFRMGAELVAERNVGFTYSLLSPWPVNAQNRPSTELERSGIDKVVAENEPFYGEETLGDTAYFTAIYPDVAVAPACVTCHNEHQDSPRRDFKINDVMGAVVIRIPVGG